MMMMMTLMKERIFNLLFRWEQGVPVGPFDSTENLNHTLLANTRVIFATCMGAAANGLERSALSYGVAGVECCVSGNFFKRYRKRARTRRGAARTHARAPTERPNSARVLRRGAGAVPLRPRALPVRGDAAVARRLAAHRRRQAGGVGVGHHRQAPAALAGARAAHGRPRGT